MAETPTSEAAGVADSSPRPEKPKGPPAMLDLVFVMDCTGSMGSYIENAKQNIASIVQKIIVFEKCDIRFCVIGYRDHPPQDSSYIIKATDFCTTLRQMQANLNELSASGGGDGPEAVVDGLDAALHLKYRDNATKICILISDAPPHGLGESGDGFPNGCPCGLDPLAVVRAMSAKDITLYTVGVLQSLGNFRHAKAFLVSIAKMTGGQAVAMESAEKLADAILAGSVEELGLRALQDDFVREVEVAVATERARVGDAVPVDDERIKASVWSSMASKNMMTRQTKCSAMTDDAEADMTSSSSLADYRSKPVVASAVPSRNRAVVPTSSSSRLGAVTSSRRTRMADDDSEEDDCCDMRERSEEKCATDMCLPSMAPTSSSSATTAPTSSITVEEDVISMEQVSRMYVKGRNKAMW